METQPLPWCFCKVWNEGDTQRRYSFGTSDREEAFRFAPAKFVELKRLSGTTVEDLWSGISMIDRAAL
jgi:hypothetical protein